jgi:hypothetical protein
VSINEQDPKANERTTFEDAEVEAHARKFRLSTTEQPEVESHGLSHGSPTQQPEVEAQAYKMKDPAEQPEVEAHGWNHGRSPVEQPEVEAHHVTYNG